MTKTFKKNAYIPFFAKNNIDVERLPKLSKTSILASFEFDEIKSRKKTDEDSKSK